jgi:DNA mismatch repair protein MutS2
MKEYLNAFARLEFDAVKSLVADYLSSSTAKALLDNAFPLPTVEEIRYALDIVTEMKRVVISKGEFFLSVPDTVYAPLQKLAIEGIFLSSQELRDIVRLLHVSKEAKKYFSEKDAALVLLSQRNEEIYTDKFLEFHIERAIDDNGNIKDTASKRLQDIRASLRDKAIHLRKKLDLILKRAVSEGYAQDEIITTREGRMVIPIKTEYKNVITGFIHSSSGSGQTVFIEPSETLQMNNEIRTLQFEEQREIENILRELSQEIAMRRYDLLNNVAVLAELEFVLAKAKYALHTNATVPSLQEHGTIRFENARHPLLLHKHRYNDIIPLTLEIGNEWKTLLITGPNAGGKTVALKTVGLLMVMVQAGFHIPVSVESQCKIIKKLFVDIGDNQSLENDLSTFSSHLENLKTVIEHADEESLILLDELGTGTDPTEGSAIAAAVLEYVTAHHALTIATTHHGELKAFAHDTEGIENAGMTFDQHTFQPTYQLRIGTPGSSYALEIAEKMNFPVHVLRRAKLYRGEIPNYLENLLNDVEKRSAHLQSELNHIQHEREHIEAERQLYETKRKELQKETKEILRKSQEEASDILAGARRLIENAVREIRETSADKNIVVKKKEEIEQLQQHLTTHRNTIHNESSTEKRTHYATGDFVKIKGSKETGEVLGATKNSEEYLVAIGSMKMKVNANEMAYIAKGKAQKQFTPKSTAATAQQKIRDIDLRGMYGEEAISLVDKFLDESMTSGIEKVYLIHGKGTGALRKRITEYLASHELVKTHYPAEWNEGGMGVTVVEILQ